MDSDYYQVTSQLDAREVLRYLNHLGIHNISGEVLKYFITDLKKLIKYDLENRNNTPSNHEREESPGPERLHSASTFSSRTRSKINDGATLNCTRECQKKRRILTARNIQSVPNLVHCNDNDKPPIRACSCVRVVKKPESRADSGKEKTTTSSNNNLIKVAKQPTKKKCDPVSLYHYYTSLWAKYKSNVPGENNWSDLRWSVRQKMAGCPVKKITSKVSDIQSQDKDGRI